jgi:hypothetical protein
MPARFLRELGATLARAREIFTASAKHSPARLPRCYDELIGDTVSAQPNGIGIAQTDEDGGDVKMFTRSHLV